MSESEKRGVIGCGMARHLKYFMLFQLDSKPIVFHIVFHEIEVRAKGDLLRESGDLLGRVKTVSGSKRFQAPRKKRWLPDG